MTTRNISKITIPSAQALIMQAAMSFSTYTPDRDDFALRVKTGMSREEYLEFRENWKALYKSLSVTIREAKDRRTPSNIPTEMLAGMNSDELIREYSSAAATFGRIATQLLTYLAYIKAANKERLQREWDTAMTI